MRLTSCLLLAIDTETTGTSVTDDLVVELGGAYFLAGEAHEPVLRTLVNPGRYIPAGASKVHGIRNEDVKEAPTWAEAGARLRAHLDELQPVLVGYNIHGFDAPLINAENDRNGLGWHLPESLDLFVFVNWGLRGAKSRKLGDICGHFGVELPADQAHTADADALATGQLLFAMVRAGVIPDDVAGAFEAQRAVMARLDAEARELGRFLFRDREDGQTIRLGLGKHAGLSLAEAEEGYLKWLLSWEAMDEPGRAVLSAHLAERNKEATQFGLF